MTDKVAPSLPPRLLEFEKRLREAQIDLPPEFAKVLNDNYWELLDGEPAKAAPPLPPVEAQHD